MPLVFQYGSNTDADRLRARLGDVEDLDRAQTIGEYDIAFDVWSQGNGCAASDLVQAPGSGRHAWGVLYSVSDAALAKLRKIEGKLYEEKIIVVRDKDGNEVTEPVTTFLVRAVDRRQGLWTSVDYVRHIVDGLRSHGVPEDYVWYVIKTAIRTNRSVTDTEPADKEINAIRRLRGLLLSPNYGLRHWQELSFSTEAEWIRAIDIVEDRIRERFMRWADTLEDKESAGFALLALDCLLIETVYGFIAGASTRNTERAYLSILTAPPFHFDKGLAQAFYDDIRCGIIHDTETRKGWVVRMTPQSQIVESDAAGARVLNRTMFHRTLNDAFKTWVSKLRAGDATLRRSLRDRMDEIIKKHYDTASRPPRRRP